MVIKFSSYGVLVAMQPGVTAALWLGPAQEYGRYRIAGDSAEI